MSLMSESEFECIQNRKVPVLCATNILVGVKSAIKPLKSIGKLLASSFGTIFIIAELETAVVVVNVGHRVESVGGGQAIVEAPDCYTVVSEDESEEGCMAEPNVTPTDCHSRNSQPGLLCTAFKKCVLGVLTDGAAALVGTFESDEVAVSTKLSQVDGSLHASPKFGIADQTCQAACTVKVAVFIITTAQAEGGEVGGYYSREVSDDSSVVIHVEACVRDNSASAVGGGTGIFECVVDHTLGQRVCVHGSFDTLADGASTGIVVTIVKEVYISFEAKQSSAKMFGTLVDVKLDDAPVLQVVYRALLGKLAGGTLLGSSYSYVDTHESENDLVERGCSSACATKYFEESDLCCKETTEVSNKIVKFHPGDSVLTIHSERVWCPVESVPLRADLIHVDCPQYSSQCTEVCANDMDLGEPILKPPVVDGALVEEVVVVGSSIYDDTSVDLVFVSEKSVSVHLQIVESKAALIDAVRPLASACEHFKFTLPAFATDNDSSCRRGQDQSRQLEDQCHLVDLACVTFGLTLAVGTIITDELTVDTSGCPEIVVTKCAQDEQ